MRKKIILSFCIICCVGTAKSQMSAHLPFYEKDVSLVYQTSSEMSPLENLDPPKVLGDVFLNLSFVIIEGDQGSCAAKALMMEVENDLEEWYRPFGVYFIHHVSTTLRTSCVSKELTYIEKGLLPIVDDNQLTVILVPEGSLENVNRSQNCFLKKSILIEYDPLVNGLTNKVSEIESGIRRMLGMPAEPLFSEKAERKLQKRLLAYEANKIKYHIRQIPSLHKKQFSIQTTQANNLTYYTVITEQ